MTDEQQQMIDDLINRQSKLTEWEIDFVDTLSNNSAPLTFKQNRKLEAIWERITA